MQKIVLILILALTMSTGALAVGSTANASTTPVMYDAAANAWHPYTRPGSIYFGQGGSPFITGLHWTSWNSKSAWGTGRLWIIKANCTPLYKCPYYSRWAGVYLNTIRLHGTTRYYARMAVEFFVSGKARWVVGWINSRGFWQFPATWPYL